MVIIEGRRRRIFLRWSILPLRSRGPLLGVHMVAVDSSHGGDQMNKIKRKNTTSGYNDPDEWQNHERFHGFHTTLGEWHTNFGRWRDSQVISQRKSATKTTATTKQPFQVLGITSESSEQLSYYQPFWWWVWEVERVWWWWWWRLTAV